MDVPVTVRMAVVMTMIVRVAVIMAVMTVMVVAGQT